MLFKAVRLRAFGDTHTAFSSTYAAESRLSDRNWIERAQEWSSKRSTTYLAMDVENPCGIVSGFFDGDDPTRAHLASMWVAPFENRSHVGQRDYRMGTPPRRGHFAARSNQQQDPAIEFYKSLGFSPTGKMAPYRNDPALNDIEMIRSISSQPSSD